ncbi:uncharacterized protein LOC141886740 isoform X4 [Acropora palmata]|uniref:uncharacterized protein LOC141886740 isoform X4 n=1 Tax=Acropora palmata TaxID=6131 RepID=UPI003D9FC0AE
MSYDDSDEVQSVADSVSSESEVNRSEEEWIKDSIQEEQTGYFYSIMVRIRNTYYGILNYVKCWSYINMV